MIIKTKKQALSNYSPGNETSYDSNALNGLYYFLLDIGARREIPERKVQKKAYLVRAFESLTVHNPYFPNELPFEYVLPKFFRSVITNQTPRKGNNVSAIIGAFETWIKSEGQKERLVEEYYRQNPDKAPRQIESQEAKSERSIEDFSDQEIIETILVLKKIKGSDTLREMLKSADSSSDEKIRRLMKQVEQRGLQIP